MIIYILKLKDNKYYIGKTEDLTLSLKKHFNSNGIEWTKMYKPIELIQTIDNYDSFDEDKYTIKYMKKYGIENVRGGSFFNLELSSYDYYTINLLIKSIESLCYRCNSSDHFINHCVVSPSESFKEVTFNERKNFDYEKELFENEKQKFEIEKRIFQYNKKKYKKMYKKQKNCFIL